MTLTEAVSTLSELLTDSKVVIPTSGLTNTAEFKVSCNGVTIDTSLVRYVIKNNRALGISLLKLILLFVRD